MPFNIEDHPFYRIVMRFEEINHHDPKQVHEVFNAFLALSKEHNVYAAHYLNYLIKNREKLGLVVPTEDDFLKDFREYFIQLPTIGEPQKWCEASQLIVLYRGASTSSSQKDDYKKRLKKLTNSAPNAIVFLMDLLSHSQDKKELWDVLSRKSDLYSLYHYRHLKGGTLKESSFQMDRGYEFVERMVNLTTVACLKLGKIEGLLANLWIQNVKSHNLIENMEGFIQHISRGDSSLIPEMQDRIKMSIVTSALMGDANACFVLIKYSSSNARYFSFIENKNRKRLTFLSACQGSRSAQLACGHIHFLNGRYNKAAHFYKMGIGSKNIDFVAPDSVYRAHANLAVMYEFGWGRLEQNDELARKHFIAAEHEGIYAHIFCPASRINFIEDIEIAVKKLELEIKRLTEENSTRHKIRIAQYHVCIGMLYYRRKEAQDHPKIFKHFKIAADFGDTFGMQKYAEILDLGIGCEVDKKGALEYFVKSARQGDSFAKLVILQKYSSGAIESLSDFGLTEAVITEYLASNLPWRKNFDSECVRGICYAKLGDKKMAYAAFKKGAEEQGAASLVNLGHIYQGKDSESGVTIDFNEAYRCYDAAARLGHGAARNFKGLCLLYGLGVSKNVIEAKRLFEEGLQENVIFAAFGLAKIYKEGHNVPIDHNRALKYLHMAEPTNRSVVFNMLGDYHFFGYGVIPVNVEKSLSYWKKSCEKGCSVGTYYYVKIKLYQEWNGSRLDEVVLRDLLEKISEPTNQKYAESQFLRTIIHLLLDSTQFPKVLDELEKRVTEKPHKGSQVMLKYLRGKTEVNNLELFTLLFEKDPAKKLQELEALKLEKLTDSATTSTSSSPSSISTRRTEVTDVEEDIARNTAKAKRVAEKVQQFVDPRNKKSINFEKFRHLFGEIATLAEEEGMIFEERFSKGSNHQFTTMSSTGDAMSTLSFHPIHKPGKGSRYDPNRARSLQTSIVDMAQAIPSLFNAINDRGGESKIAHDRSSISSSSTTTLEDGDWTSYFSGTHSSSSSSSSSVWLPQNTHAKKSGINTSSSSSTPMSSGVQASVSNSLSSSSNASSNAKKKGKK